MCEIVNSKLSIDDEIYDLVIKSYDSKCPERGSFGIGSIVKRYRSFHLFNAYLKTLGKSSLNRDLFVVTGINRDMITLGELGKEFNKKNFRLIGHVPYKNFPFNTQD